MKKYYSLILALLLLALPILGQCDGETDASLLAALTGMDSRPIYLQAYQTDAQTGLRCAFFVTQSDEEPPGYTTDFAFWFVLEGKSPQLLFEGSQQAPPEDEWEDTRLYPREYLQAFTHQEFSYFIASLRTGERQSDFSKLYMVEEGQLVEITGLYSGGGYHPDVGLYSLSYDYATDPGFEAGRELTPVFLYLNGKEVQKTGGIPVDIYALNELSNGKEIEAALQTQDKSVYREEVVYYLPNNMFVANYRNHISSEEMDELFSVYVGVENGKGFLVRYPYELETPDCLVPFWQLCQNADEALVNSGLYYNEYYDYIYQDALTAPRLLSPLDGMVLFQSPQ